MNRSRRQPQEHRPEFFGEVFTSTEELSPHPRERAVPDSSLGRAGRVILSSIAGAIFLYSLVGFSLDENPDRFNQVKEEIRDELIR